MVRWLRSLIEALLPWYDPARERARTLATDEAVAEGRRLTDVIRERYQIEDRAVRSRLTNER